MDIQTVPEEVLIRWRHGVFSGAHVVLERMAPRGDGEVDFFQLSSAIPLAWSPEIPTQEIISRLEELIAALREPVAE